MILSLNGVATTPAIIVTLSSFDQATSSSTERLGPCERARFRTSVT